MSRWNQAIRYAKLAALVLFPVVLIGVSFYRGIQDQSKDNFTVSGTTDGLAISVAIVGPDYTGNTDWATIGALKRKVWSPYEIQINTADTTPGADGENKWSTSFHPVSVGEYKLITYDPRHDEQVIAVQNLTVARK